MAKTTLVQNETTPTQLNITQLAADGYATAGTQDGDPILADDINDYKGFSANALQKAGITASQNPDTQASSQTHDALEISVNKNAPDGTAANPSISFKQDQNTGLFRKGSDSIGVSTGGVERLNVRSDGRVGINTDGINIEAQLHVEHEQKAIGILSRGTFTGSTESPYVNNDVILCETYNKTLSDSFNRSWAISCSNAYHDIPVGVTDSGTRVGAIGWAVSVKGRPGFEHRGTLGEMSGLMGTSGFQGEGYDGAEIVEAVGVRGVIYADNSNATIKFARAGLFASDGVDGGTTIEENAAIYARAQRGTVSNYAFYGELGELYNQNVIHSPEQVAGGSKYNEGGKVTARFGGNGLEFGYPQAGYGGFLGGTHSTGYPFLTFCAKADATGDTFTTTGKKGQVAYNNLAGDLVLGRLTDANASGQTPVEDLRWSDSGKFVFDKNPVIRNSNPPANSTASGVMGEIAWDSDYIYICVSDNVWKRSPLSTW